ncbi:hypothetical protein QTP88_005909 [Uroleucon formosanum]
MSEIKFIIKLPIFMYTKGEKRLRTAVLILSNVTHVMSVLHICIMASRSALSINEKKSILSNYDKLPDKTNQRLAAQQLGIPQST